MADPAGEPPEPSAPEDAPPRRGLRRRWMLLGALGGASALALGLVWSERTTIADKLIAGQMRARHLPGTYKVESISASSQVLSHIVIGDPAHPDLTVERAEVVTALHLGTPTVESVVLVRPRLRGTYREARFSVGALDKLLFSGSTAPATLPDLDVTLIDGRAHLESDFGPIGIKADGKGNLKNGFAGLIALAAPQLAAGGCNASGVALNGRITTAAGAPRFVGPLTAPALDCGGVKARALAADLDLGAGAALDSAHGKLALRSGPVLAGGQRAAGLDGTAQFDFAHGDLTARYTMAARDFAGPVVAGGLSGEGIVRSHQNFARIESEGTLAGRGLGLGADSSAALGRAQVAAAGTLGAPLLARLGAALAAARAGNRLSGQYLLRRDGDGLSVTVPQAALASAKGAPLAAANHLQYSTGKGLPPRFSGNLATLGGDLPRASAQVQQIGGGAIGAKLTLANYTAADAALALPVMQVLRQSDGTVRFAGQAALSGAFPGGQATALALPLEGTWSARGGLALGQRCTPVRFARLQLANLALADQALNLCPGGNGPIVQAGAGGLRIAAGVGALDLAGKLGSTPISVHSGGAGLAWPGALSAKNVEVVLGPADHPNRFSIAQLTGRLGQASAGTFAGTAAHLDAVPLEIGAAGGAWRLAGQRLELSGATFTVSDRQTDARFRPLIARGAGLTLVGDALSANATLHEPKSDRAVSVVTIAHNLASGVGHADLMVPGLVFDDKLQPDTLSHLALGVIASAKGTVKGNGRIDWGGADVGGNGGVTSSGTFGTDWLDFLAAFGPVSGAQGSVVFTDLLGLVTAPDQKLHLASINPGIEVNDGVVTFALQPEGVLAVKGAHWPFVGGSLDLLPTQMVLGAAEVRRFTLSVDGIDAAQFVQRLELANISATGTFDGRLPLIFDQNGGRIEGGVLTSRAPGGNLAYVGALTYKDLSPMGNFAFDALKSIDYKQMEIGFNGSLTGELITKVSFDGLGQGQGARSNFLTRQVSRLPLRFNVNIHAPFFGLFGTFKSLYDPSLVADPRSIGLLDPKSGVQPPASETVR